MLCCIRNRCNLSEHAPKKNAVVRFPLYRKERRDDTKVDLDFLFPLFVLSLVSLELCVCLQFWFLRCVSSTGNCKGRMSTEREGERGGREETAEVECSVRFIVSVLHLNCLMLDFGYAPRKKAWFFKVIWCFSNTTTRGNQKSFQYLELNYQICHNYLLEMSEN